MVNITFDPTDGTISFFYENGIQGDVDLQEVAWFGAGTFTVTPLPAALPLFATGLGALGLLSWRRKRKAQAARLA